VKKGIRRRFFLKKVVRDAGESREIFIHKEEKEARIGWSF
jgi:hypothetical protein